MNTVPRIWTPVHVDSLRVSVHAGYHSVFGECPGDPRMRLFWSQCVHEHGWDARTGVSRGIACWNIGNIDAPRDTVEPVFVTVPEREVIGGRETRQEHIRRAFPSLDSGCRAYWVRMRDKYAAALTVDSPAALARALKRARYYTGAESEYASAIGRHSATYDRRYAGDEFETFCGWLC